METREKAITSIHDLPAVPGVYAMYGGTSGRRYVAYVGIAGNLKQRLNQLLVLRDSSITTQTGAVRLDPDHVMEVEWFESKLLDGRVLARMKRMV